MSEVKIGYKAFTLENGKIKSWNDQFQTYFKTVWNKRRKNCGPLAVMENLDALKTMVSGSRDPAIYKVEYTESDDNKLWVRMKKDGSAEEGPWDCKYSYPETIYADTVRLLEKIL